MVRLRELVAAVHHHLGSPPVDHLGHLMPAGATEANCALNSLRSFT